MKLRVLSRLLQIQRVLVRHGLDDVILATHLFRPLRFAFLLSPATWFHRERAGSRPRMGQRKLDVLGTRLELPRVQRSTSNDRDPAPHACRPPEIRPGCDMTTGDVRTADLRTDYTIDLPAVGERQQGQAVDRGAREGSGQH